MGDGFYNPYAPWATGTGGQRATTPSNHPYQQWPGGSSTPGSSQTPQIQPNLFYNVPIVPRSPVYYPVPNAYSGYPSYVTQPIYPNAQYLHPGNTGYPGYPGSMPGGAQYYPRPHSAPGTPQPQTPTQPKGLGDLLMDALAKGLKKLDVASSPSPMSGSANNYGPEPSYHSFRLNPLPPGGNSFRLVEFPPVPTPQSPISCKISGFNLQNHPEYIALSYPCSVSRISRRFRTLERIPCNTGYIEVCGGMLDILHGVLDRYNPTFMWIDCFCISARDPVEKAEQIATMKHIYRKARETVIWLEQPGDDASQVGAAFDVLKIGYTHFNNLKTRQALMSKWSSTFAVVNTIAFCQLLQKTYFSRTWILQEATLSSQAVIYCCKYRVRWADFCEQLSCLMQIGYVDMLMFHYPNTSALTPNSVWIARHRAIITLWRKLEQQRRQNRPPTEPLPLKLKQLMRLTRGMNATDLRDRVYALLGLCADHDEITVNTRPEYTVAMLYHHLAVYFTKRHSASCDCNSTVCPDKELSFLGDAGIRDWRGASFADIQEKDRSSLMTLPSWVPVWEYRPLRTMWTEAHNAQFKAGGKTCPSIWHDPDSALPRNLFVSGVITSRVRYVTTPCPTFHDKPEFVQLSNASKIVSSYRITGRWYQEAFTMVQRYIPASQNRTEMFCCTLCANSSHLEGDDLLPEAPRLPISNGRELARWFDDFMALYEFAEQCQPLNDVLTVAMSAALKNHGEGAEKWQEIARFCVPHSTFFLTEDGRMGLGPGLTQVGDEVCVFKGAPMPTVLRAAPRTTGVQYELVGVSYVLGLMNGEAFQLFGDKEDLLCLV